MGVAALESRDFSALDRSLDPSSLSSAKTYKSAYKKTASR
jgi:hypothetical protein